MNAIEIDNLCKIYQGKRGARVDALKNLSLNIGQGEVFGFLGPNGAGKSTTIKCLMGLIKPASGKARIMGVDCFSSLSRRLVGYLPENPSFYDYLSAEEYLLFVGRVFVLTETKLKIEVEKALNLMELWDARKRPMRGYSKGMIQRVGLAQTLIHNPDVYILDEPMSGLDPLGRALVKNIIIKLKEQGKSVFFSTHITADVEAVCDRVGVIFNGDLKRVDRVDNILKEGITGYLVKSRGTDEEREVLVPQDQLAVTLVLLEREGRQVTLVEPVRKDLEQFFLDIVREG